MNFRRQSLWFSNDRSLMLSPEPPTLFSSIKKWQQQGILSVGHISFSVDFTVGVLRVDFADGNNFRQGWGFRSWRGILYGLIFIIITKWFYGVFVKGKIKNHPPPHLLCTPPVMTFFENFTYFHLLRPPNYGFSMKCGPPTIIDPPIIRHSRVDHHI